MNVWHDSVSEHELKMWQEKAIFAEEQLKEVGRDVEQRLEAKFNSYQRMSRARDIEISDLTRKNAQLESELEALRDIEISDLRRKNAQLESDLKALKDIEIPDLTRKNAQLESEVKAIKQEKYYYQEKCQDFEKELAQNKFYYEEKCEVLTTELKKAEKKKTNQQTIQEEMFSYQQDKSKKWKSAGFEEKGIGKLKMSITHAGLPHNAVQVLVQLL